MNSKLDSLLSRLAGVKKTGDGRYIAKCPAHSDKSPSLAITQVDEKILLHCFAGCAVNDVLAAVGMELSDLFPDLEGTFKPLTDAEKQAFAKQRQADELKRKAEEKARHEEAIRKADYIWSRSEPVTDHSYLAKKHVNSHNVRSYRGSLVIPLCDENGVLVSLQFIGDDGTKRMMKDGKAQGSCCFIGDIGDLQPGGTILIAEGWATGASLYEATGHFTIATFSAGNLKAVAIQSRKQRPDNEIIICGDHDVSGVGQKAAREAALAINCKYIKPPIEGMDFNDWLNREVV